MDKIKMFLIFVIIQLFLIKQQFFSLIHNLIHHGSLSSFQIILYWASILFNVQLSLIYCLKLMYFFAFFLGRNISIRKKLLFILFSTRKIKLSNFFFIVEIKTDKFSRAIAIHTRIQFDVPWRASVPCAQQFRIN